MIEVRYREKTKSVAHGLWMEDASRKQFLSQNFGIPEEDLESLLIVPIYNQQSDRSSLKEKRLLTFLDIQTINLSDIKELLLIPEFREQRVSIQTIVKLKRYTSPVVIRSSRITIITSCFALCKENIGSQELFVDHMSHSKFDMEYAVFYSQDPDTTLQPRYIVPITVSLPSLVLNWFLSRKTPDVVKSEVPQFESFKERLESLEGRNTTQEGFLKAFWVLHPYSARLLLSSNKPSKSLR